MKHLKKIIFSSTVCLSLALAGPSLAHVNGASLEKDADSYFIDVGNSEQTLEVGDSVRFDFSLFEQQDRNQPVEFTDIWVRISQGNKSIFAGDLARPRLGSTGMTTVFPDEGEYELYVRYHNQDQTLVETTFPLSVEPNADQIKQARTKLVVGVFVAIVGILLSFLVGFLISNYLPEKKHVTHKK